MLTYKQLVAMIEDMGDVEKESTVTFVDILSDEAYPLKLASASIQDEGVMGEIACGLNDPDSNIYKHPVLIVDE
jgi:hypothetical protein